MMRMQIGFLMFGVVGLLAVAACNPQQQQEATIGATDACVLAQAALTADPALAKHNQKAATIGTTACALAPSVIQSVQPLTPAPVPAPTVTLAPGSP